MFRIGIAAALTLIIVNAAGATAAPADMILFAELSPRDVTRLEQQRAVVAFALKEHFGASLTRTIADLPVLRRLLDDQVFAKSQTYELQCVGVAFGDILASELPLRWVVVSDEYGTDPTLRFENTTLRFNALTMISKRIEDGRQVNLAELFDAARDHLAKLAGKTD